jgi:hypothetical protein
MLMLIDDASCFQVTVAPAISSASAPDAQRADVTCSEYSAKAVRSSKLAAWTALPTDIASARMD